MKEIIKKIKQYDTIIIHRHKNPDLDAYGSQLGLAYTLKENFKDKKIFVVGDDNHFSWMGQMDTIDDSIYNNALVFVLDVAVMHLISDDRFKLGKEIIVMDHHKNSADFEALLYIDSNYGAAAELIADFVYQNKLTMTSEAATMFFGGIIADTGRFQYTLNNPNPLLIGSKLLSDGAKADFIYDNLYQETLESKRNKAYFANSFSLTSKNVAYLKNDKTIYDKFDLKPFNISRGMIGVMAGIKEVPIWCNFTFDPESEKIMCEFRSKKIKIVDIAKKYGGGGHDLACGATVENFDICDLILKDFDDLIESENN
ncbi:MAG: bifunctional oligoribonuclease/PAP phosphatase NrnA [bacterium]